MNATTIMVFDIYASILRPAGDGDFRVVVSAFPTDPQQPLAVPYAGKGDAATLSQAEALRRHLASSVVSAVKDGGHEPGRVVFR